MIYVRRLLSPLVLLVVGALLWSGAANALVPVGSGSWRGGGPASSCTGALTPAMASCITAKWNSIADEGKLDQCTFFNITATSATARCHFIPNNNFLDNGNAEAVAGSCPANSTPSGGECQCTSPYVENASKTACKLPPVQCTPGRVISSGYFDAGSTVANGPPYIVCDKGCSAAFDGSFPEGSALVGGKMHYFAKGSYAQNGSNCDSGGGPGDPSGDGNAPNPTDAVPPDSCAPGEAAGVVNGKGVCAPDMTQEGEGTKTPPKPEPPKSDDKKTSETTVDTTKNADGSKTVVTTTVTKNTDGTSKKEVTTDKYDKDGNKISSSKEESGSAITKEAGKEGDDAKKDKCSKNSSDTGCGGDPKEVNGAELYKAKTDTVKGILSGAKDNLLSSPIGSAAGNFFSVSGGGSCPTVSGRIPFIDKVVTFDTFCSEFAMVMLLTIKGVLLLLATWWAFRIAIE